jgi:hypothetical protein
LQIILISRCRSSQNTRDFLTRCHGLPYLISNPWGHGANH